MQKTIFEISKMDCPSEENLIRIKLDDISAVKNLDFDIPARRLTIFHIGQLELIEDAIGDLNLGSKTIKTEERGHVEFAEQDNQKKIVVVCSRH